MCTIWAKFAHKRQNVFYADLAYRDFPSWNIEQYQVSGNVGLQRGGLHFEEWI